MQAGGGRLSAAVFGPQKERTGGSWSFTPVLCCLLRPLTGAWPYDSPGGWGADEIRKHVTKRSDNTLTMSCLQGAD
jgi:hypothetical protein